jgi:hypothetical protein
MTSWIGLLILLLTLAQTGFARAESQESKERIARMSCLSGDYAKGVAILAELFVDTMNSTFIFNQGRCFEQNRRWEDAISRFEEYLRVNKKPKKSDKAEAEKHIAECQVQLAKQSSHPAAPVVSQSPVPPVAPPVDEPLRAVPPAPPVSPVPVVQQAAPQSTSGSGLRTAGIITASVGGAALISGLIFNLKANSMISDMQKLDGYSSSKASDRDSYVTLGWIGYGVGAACVATGAILYYFGLRSTPSSGSVALVPAPGPGQFGALLKGAF